MVTSVAEVLREEIVGLVKTREAALEPSDQALKSSSLVGDTATSLVVFRRWCSGFSVSSESNSETSSCSVNVGRSVFGLIVGDAVIPLSTLPSEFNSKWNMSESEVFLWYSIPRSSAGVFACGRLFAWVQLGRGEEYGGKLATVPDRGGGVRRDEAE